MSKPLQDCSLVFGINIRAAREMRRMTQANLAKRVRMTRPSVVNIEKGRQRVLLHHVDLFAQALAVPKVTLAKAIWT